MIEALVAIAVLTIGVIGPLSMLAQSITNSNYAKNQIVAFFLAQEGQEMVINRRDNNRMSGAADWLDGLAVCGNACYVDPVDNPVNFNTCPAEGCPKIKLRDTGFYGYGADGVETIFTRVIRVLPVPPTAPDTESREAQVQVTVNWQNRSLTRTFTINSVIYR